MIRNILQTLEKNDFRLCSVYLVDAHYASDAGMSLYHTKNHHQHRHYYYLINEKFDIFYFLVKL